MESLMQERPGLELPPHAPFLMQSMRSLGYSLQSALADLIDNSVAAQATIIQINFSHNGMPRIAILDNGFGMSEDALVSAMRFGSMDPRQIRGQTDLGRFGLGMKTASLSQCRRLTVVSRQGEHLNAARWDLDESERRQSWWLSRPSLSEIDAYLLDALQTQGQGTVVIWENLDRLSAEGASNPRYSVARVVEEAADHLALVFHRFLSGEMRGGFEITLNGRPLARLDPFLAGHARGQTLHGESFPLDGHSVTVSPFVLPFPSRLGDDELAKAGGREFLKTGHGFYIYRGGRLVVPGGWFRIVPHDQLVRLARVRVDVPVALDHIWKVDIRKASAEPPHALREHLKRIVGNVTDRSRRVYTHKGTTQRTADHMPLWSRNDGRDGSARWLVNRDHPIVAAALQEKTSSADVGRLLRFLEDSIPAHEIHLHMSNDLSVSEKPMDKGELREVFQQLVTAFGDNPEMLKTLRERLPMMEPFNRYPEEARVLAAEIQ